MQKDYHRAISGHVVLDGDNIQTVFSSSSVMEPLESSFLSPSLCSPWSSPSECSARGTVA
jgi:hypothetical protein